MRIVFASAAFLLTGALLGSDGAVIRGFVRDGSGASLPGVTLHLDSDPRTDIYTDADGSFQTKPLPSGTYYVYASLEGLTGATAKVQLSESDASVELVLIPDPATEGVILSCGAPECSNEPTLAPHDPPTCEAVEMNDTLFLALEQGDESAASLLARRYKEEVSLRERIRIAEKLIAGHDRDGSHYRFLHSLAERALSVAAIINENYEYTYDHAFVTDCDSRGTTAADEWRALMAAFEATITDRRSTPLLSRGLESRSIDLVDAAVREYVRRKDLSILPRLDAILSKHANSDWLASSLLVYETEEADTIAKRYLSEDDYASMIKSRNSVD